MLFLEICVTNLSIVTSLNNDVQPSFKLNEFGGVDPTYLVITPGKPNRVIDWVVFRRYRKIFKVAATQRRFYYTQ